MVQKNIGCHSKSVRKNYPWRYLLKFFHHLKLDSLLTWMVSVHLEELFWKRYHVWFLNMDTEGIRMRAKTMKQTETVIHKCGHNKPSRPKHKQGMACHPTPGQRVSPSLMRSFLPPSPSRRLPPTPTTFNERETPGTVGQVRVGGTLPPSQVLSLEWTLNWSRLPQGSVRNPPPTSSNVSAPACSLRKKGKKEL